MGMTVGACTKQDYLSVAVYGLQSAVQFALAVTDIMLAVNYQHEVM
jgi:hypothetical protein